jgi:hypothetical protein
MQRLKRLAMAVLFTAATSITIVAALPGAASAATVPGCAAPSVSTDGHTLTVKCSGIKYHGTQYKITAKVCSVSPTCPTVGSNPVAYGTTAKISGGSGYPQASTVAISWMNGSSACAFTTRGGDVAWCDMQASINYWAGLSPQITYCEGCNYTQNWYHDTSYFADCSGLVSMAWHLTSDQNTGTLGGFGTPVSQSYGTTKSYVQKGDAMNNASEGHAVIFAGWALDHKHFSVWSFGDGTMSSKHLFTGQPKWGSPSEGGAAGWLIAGHYQKNYVALRYDNKSGL